MGTVTQIDRHQIIFFDGVCNLCNAAVKFIIKRDQNSIFKFASLQSAAAEKHLPPDNHHMGSIVLLKGDRIFKESDAVLEIARKLGGGWPILYGCKVIPKFMRDAVYRLVANHRYKWFGMKDKCMVPTSELQARFLDS